MNNSAIKLLEILELFADSKESLTISDISKKLGYPKTSVFDIVHILLQNNYLQCDNQTAKTYTLGYKPYRIGMAYMDKINIYSIVHPVLVELSKEIHETCFLATRDQSHVIYLDKVESDAMFRISNNIGTKNLLYLTGLGKAILATYPDETIRELVHEPFELHTETTNRNMDELLKDLHQIRKKGYSFDNGENHPWLRCFAAPLRDATGNCNTAISIAMLYANYNEENAAKAIKLITDAALSISHTLGFQGNCLY